MSTNFENGWLRVIDEELVSTHIGVAEVTDTYEIAKAKLAQIIAWHVAVATDPAVNGGFKLVPFAESAVPDGWQQHLARIESYAEWIKRKLDSEDYFGKNAPIDLKNGPIYEAAERAIFILNCVRSMRATLAAAPKTVEHVVPDGWQPIGTAPKDGKRPLLLARFNDDGTLQSFDYDGTWESGYENWETPQRYYFWASAEGCVEEPSHWMYQPEWFANLSPKPEDE